MTCATLYYYVMQAIHNPRNLDFIYALLYYTAYWDGGWVTKNYCTLTSISGTKFVCLMCTLTIVSFGEKPALDI